MCRRNSWEEVIHSLGSSAHRAPVADALYRVDRAGCHKAATSPMAVGRNCYWIGERESRAPIDGARRRKRGEEHTYTEADQTDLVHLSLLFDFDAASSANVRGSMLRANLDRRELDVVSLA